MFQSQPTALKKLKSPNNSKGYFANRFQSASKIGVRQNAENVKISSIEKPSTILSGKLTSLDF